MTNSKSVLGSDKQFKDFIKEQKDSKVYLLKYFIEYDCPNLVGIYSTLEKATENAKKQMVCIEQEYSHPADPEYHYEENTVSEWKEEPSNFNLKYCWVATTYGDSKIYLTIEECKLDIDI
jgi:hypothetical protein